MWAHHIAEALGCFLMTCFRQAAFFPMMFAVTELTVLPANILWMAQKFERSESSKLVPALLLLRFFAFLGLRAFILPYTLKYAMDRGNFVNNVKLTHPFVIGASTINMVRCAPTRPTHHTTNPAQSLTTARPAPISPCTLLRPCGRACWDS